MNLIFESGKYKTHEILISIHEMHTLNEIKAKQVSPTNVKVKQYRADEKKKKKEKEERKMEQNIDIQKLIKVNKNSKTVRH
jgi:ABC-type lipoprotein release transport system permease subunit